MELRPLSTFDCYAWTLRKWLHVSICTYVISAIVSRTVSLPDKCVYLNSMCVCVFSSQTYVVGTQKNRLLRRFFEHPKRMIKLMGKEIIERRDEISNNVV